VNFIASQQFEKVYLVGNIFKTLTDGDESLRQWMNGNCFSSVTELCDELQKNPLKGYYILLKGSHSVHLEQAVPFYSDLVRNNISMKLIPNLVKSEFSAFRRVEC
jgi:UDP-N-acetylmuramoyl-tripeptide--D-alanyl-D-alanine ligase